MRRRVRCGIVPGRVPSPQKSLDPLANIDCGALMRGERPALLPGPGPACGFKTPPGRLSARAVARSRKDRLRHPKEGLDAVPSDTTDNRILECAVAADSEAVATGDRHLLSLGSVRGIRIQSVSEFLAAFQSRER